MSLVAVGWKKWKEEASFFREDRKLKESSVSQTKEKYLFGVFCICADRLQPRWPLSMKAEAERPLMRRKPRAQPPQLLNLLKQCGLRCQIPKDDAFTEEHTR